MKHQSGRSMVEILGVLAIIGVLSVGGLAAYRYAMDKKFVNDLIYDLNLADTEIMTDGVGPDIEPWAKFPLAVFKERFDDGFHPNLVFVKTYDVENGQIVPPPEPTDDSTEKEQDLYELWESGFDEQYMVGFTNLTSKQCVDVIRSLRLGYLYTADDKIISFDSDDDIADFCSDNGFSDVVAFNFSLISSAFAADSDEKTAPISSTLKESRVILNGLKTYKDVRFFAKPSQVNQSKNYKDTNFLGRCPDNHYKTKINDKTQCVPCPGHTVTTDPIMTLDGYGGCGCPKSAPVLLDPDKGLCGICENQTYAKSTITGTGWNKKVTKVVCEACPPNSVRYNEETEKGVQFIADEITGDGCKCKTGYFLSTLDDDQKVCTQCEGNSVFGKKEGNDVFVKGTNFLNKEKETYACLCKSPSRKIPYWNGVEKQCGICPSGTTREEKKYFDAYKTKYFEETIDLNTDTFCGCPIEKPYWNGTACEACPDGTVWDHSKGKCLLCIDNFEKNDEETAKGNVFLDKEKTYYADEDEKYKLPNGVCVACPEGSTLTKFGKAKGSWFGAQIENAKLTLENKWVIETNSGEKYACACGEGEYFNKGLFGAGCKDSDNGKYNPLTNTDDGKFCSVALADVKAKENQWGKAKDYLILTKVQSLDALKFGIEAYQYSVKLNQDKINEMKAKGYQYSLNWDGIAPLNLCQDDLLVEYSGDVDGYYCQDGMFPKGKSLDGDENSDPAKKLYEADGKKTDCEECPKGTYFHLGAKVNEQSRYKEAQCMACEAGKEFRDGLCQCPQGTGQFTGGEIKKGSNCHCPENQHWKEEKCEPCPSDEPYFFDGACQKCPEGKIDHNGICVSKCFNGMCPEGLECWEQADVDKALTYVSDDKKKDLKTKLTEMVGLCLDLAQGACAPSGMYGCRTQFGGIIAEIVCGEGEWYHPCPSGTYNDDSTLCPIAEKDCKKCPADKPYSVAGATLARDCFSCPEHSQTTKDFGGELIEAKEKQKLISDCYCDDGYYAVNGRTRCCEDGEVWDAETQKCIPPKCTIGCSSNDDANCRGGDEFTESFENGKSLTCYCPADKPIYHNDKCNSCSDVIKGSVTVSGGEKISVKSFITDSDQTCYCPKDAPNFMDRLDPEKGEIGFCESCRDGTLFSEDSCVTCYNIDSSKPVYNNGVCEACPGGSGVRSEFNSNGYDGGVICTGDVCMGKQYCYCKANAYWNGEKCVVSDGKLETCLYNVGHQYGFGVIENGICVEASSYCKSYCDKAFTNRVQDSHFDDYNKRCVCQVKKMPVADADGWATCNAVCDNGTDGQLIWSDSDQMEMCLCDV